MKKLKLVLPILSIFLSCSIYGQMEPQNTGSEVQPKIKNENEVQKIKFTRPEERGENFSVKTNTELLNILRSSRDKIELRKVAKALGDREMDGSLTLTGLEKLLLDNTVQEYLKQIKSKDPNVYDEASQQIFRLWHLAAPTLLKNLDNDNVTIIEFAAKSLILMRNEDIIKAIIEIANNTRDEKQKELLLFFLSQMKEQRTTVVPDRNCLNESESEELFNQLVQPALTKINIE